MKKLIFSFLILFVWSCQKEQTTTISKPSPFLDEAEMVQLMMHLQLADAQVAQLHITSTDSAVMVYQHLEQQIFKKNQIDSSIYRKNYRYYLQDLKTFKRIAQTVMDSLQKREEIAQKTPMPTTPGTVPTARPTITPPTRPVPTEKSMSPTEAAKYKEGRRPQ